MVDADNVASNTNHRLDGYHVTDLTMDGITLFAGPNNDLNLLLGNVLLYPDNASMAANYIVHGALPE